MSLDHFLDEPIQPFPADQDRDHFGSWLSGFTESRGHFDLISKDCSDDSFDVGASFRIRVRLDSLGTLRLIQSFLGVGVIYVEERYGQQGRRYPFADLMVTDPADLHDVIIPHFRRYPLLGRRANEFAVFCKGVSMIYRKVQEMN